MKNILFLMLFLTTLKGATVLANVDHHIETPAFEFVSEMLTEFTRESELKFVVYPADIPTSDKIGAWGASVAMIDSKSNETYGFMRLLFYHYQLETFEVEVFDRHGKLKKLHFENQTKALQEINVIISHLMILATNNKYDKLLIDPDKALGKYHESVNSRIVMLLRELSISADDHMVLNERLGQKELDNLVVDIEQGRELRKSKAMKLALPLFGQFLFLAEGAWVLSAERGHYLIPLAMMTAGLAIIHFKFILPILKDLKSIHRSLKNGQAARLKHVNMVEATSARLKKFKTHLIEIKQKYCEKTLKK